MSGSSQDVIAYPLARDEWRLMSQYYMAGEVVLWNPSSGASRLFTGQVRLVESELHLVSGIGPMESDQCQVDLAVLNSFARALAGEASLRTHEVVRALAEGVVVTVLAVAHRAGLMETWPPPADDLEAEFRERGRRLESSLPR